MKRTRLLLATLVTTLCVLLGFATAACAKDVPPTYSVTFNVQGHGEAPAAITDIEEGAKIQKPADPVAEDYTFGGWFKDAACQYEWKFDTDTVTSSRTLYAKWTDKIYTLTFDMQEHGAQIAAQTGLIKGTKAQEPAAPTEEGFVFAGWYKETECENLWDFATDAVNGDTTIYAKWKEIYVVSAEESAKFRVDEENYFTVPVAGTYSFVFVNDEASSDQFKLDGETEQQIVNGNAGKYLLDEGRHTIDTLGVPFDVTVSLEEVDLPFTKLNSYFGSEYELNVISLGVDFITEVKNNVVMIRFGAIGSAEYMTVDNFDGEYYHASSAKCHVKLGITGDDVSDTVSIKAYVAFEDNKGNWEYPSELTDTLTRAKNATEIVKKMAVTDAGAENTAEIENSFNYAYFDVADYLGEWLVFSYAAGTQFRWVDVEYGRTGDLADDIPIEADTPIKLNNGSGYTHMAVRPASGNSVTFTVKTSEAPVGLTEDNPIVMTGTTQTLRDSNASYMAPIDYYIQFNAETAGFYNITLSSQTGSSTTVSYTTYFEVNGEKYGYYNMTWYGGLSNSAPTAKVSLNTTNSIMVKLTSSSATYTLTVEKVPEKVHGTLVTGVFRGTDDSDVTHMLDVNVDMKSVTYTRIFNGNKQQIGTGTYSEQNGEYAFIADTKEYTFEVNEDGSLVFDTNGNGNVTLCLFDSSKEANLAGRYTTEMVDGDPETDRPEDITRYNVYLIISGTPDTGFTANYYCSEWDMIEENRPIGYKDGQYYFNYWLYNAETAYITIDSENKLTISGFNPTASRTDWAEFTKTDEYPLALASETYVYNDGTTKYTAAIEFYYGVYTVSFNGGSAAVLSYENGKFVATVSVGGNEVTLSITKKTDTVILVEGFDGADSSADFEVKEDGGSQGETADLSEGTYKNGNWTLVITKNGDAYTGTYQDASSMLTPVEITLVAANGGYTFTWSDSTGYEFTSTLTVLSKGKVMIGNYNGWDDSATFVQEGYLIEAGKYTYDDGKFTLTIKEEGDSYTGTYKDASSMMQPADIRLVYANGKWTFTCKDFSNTERTVTITVLSVERLQLANYDGGGDTHTANFEKEEFVALAQGKYASVGLPANHIIEIVGNDTLGYTVNYTYGNFAPLENLAITIGDDSYSFDVSLMDGMVEFTVNFKISKDRSFLTVTSSNDKNNSGPNGTFQNVER